jgi:hypothetical protein
LEFGLIAADGLEEFNVLAVDVHPWGQFDQRISLLYGRSVNSIVVVLVLECGQTVLADHQRVPTGTHIVDLVRILDRVLESLLVPWSQEH